MRGMILTLTRPLVHLIGRPAAWAWARLVGVHVRWLAATAILFSTLCLLMDAKAQLLALNFDTMIMVGLLLAFTPFFLHYVDDTPEYDNGEAKAISSNEMFLRLMLLIAALALPLDLYGAVLGRDDMTAFGHKLVNNPSWWNVGESGAKVLGLSALFAGNRQARTVWAHAAAFARTVGVRWGISQEQPAPLPEPARDRDLVDA